MKVVLVTQDRTQGQQNYAHILVVNAVESTKISNLNKEHTVKGSHRCNGHVKGEGLENPNRHLQTYRNH